ncbi:MAG TPA: long-chain fatty acid--CoA ligase [Acidimicrobiia bacterium]|nr:long-chain fatty acid--CoA ligase [Acidimicrobiia bacterium]
MNLLSPLRRAVSVGAARPAVLGDGPLTYEELWTRCRRLSGALAGLGLQRGDRVAVAAANSRAYLELYQTVPGAGYVLVPLNVRHTQAELAYALADSATSVIFTDLDPEPFAGLVKQVISLPDQYEELLAGAAEQEPPDDGVDENDLAGLFYTGGTTGAAKGVMLTHRNLLANAFHFMACWPFTPDTRWLVAAPMFHAAGTIGVLSIVWNAGSHVFLERFDPGAALDLIEAHGVTATLGVPTMLAALADEQRRRPRDVSSLTHLSYGGAPSATETLRQAQAAFPAATLLHIYGATETSPIVTLLPDQGRMLDSPRARSCGQPAVGVEVRIADADGNPAPTGEVGEVCARGPNIMAGYWNKPEETARALRGGWYRTGDLAYMDEEAYVFHVDRSKDMIVTGGENVYSSEVENALYQHPAVAEAAVFGVPHPRWGEAVHAALVLRSDVDEEELRRHCRALIADYKVPKTFEFLRELPKSGAGKVLKRELRRPHWADKEGFVG